MPDPWRWIGDQIADIVAPAGFKRSKSSFVDLTVPDVRKQITIERSRWNTPVWRRFALVVSIYLPDSDDAGPAPKDWKDHSTPVFHKNAGYLWGDEAHLCDVPDVVPSDELAAELRAHLTGHVLPFLQRCSSLDALLGVLDGENKRLGENFFSIALALALARMGRTEQSRKYFKESLGDPEDIRQMALHHGITI
jgi:hypothetical protein